MLELVLLVLLPLVVLLPSPIMKGMMPHSYSSSPSISKASRRCLSCLERWLLVRQGGDAMMQKREQTLCPRALGEGGLLSCWVDGNRVG